MPDSEVQPKPCIQLLGTMEWRDVTILQDSPDIGPKVLIRIDTGDDQFWVRRERVKFPSVGPVYVANAVPESISEFIGYLQSTAYTLHVVCRNEVQVMQAEEEYRDWSGGKELPEGTVLCAFDGSNFDREWFLIFRYDPLIEYPFAVLERGTGGRKRQKFPVAWHRKGTIESCYSAIAEAVVRAGLEAQYK